MKRLPYTLCLLALTFIYLPFISLINQLTKNLESDGDCATVSLINLGVVIIFVWFCLARRIKDSGKNPHLAWLFFIPVIGFFFSIYMCFPVSKTPDGFTGTFKQKEGLQNGKLEWDDK